MMSAPMRAAAVPPACANEESMQIVGRAPSAGRSPRKRAWPGRARIQIPSKLNISSRRPVALALCHLPPPSGIRTIQAEKTTTNEQQRHICCCAACLRRRARDGGGFVSSYRGAGDGGPMGRAWAQPTTATTTRPEWAGQTERGEGNNFKTIAMKFSTAPRLELADASEWGWLAG
jgi:hypothetical protein